MIKEILTYPKNKDILTSKSIEVQENEDITELIQDLKDTLNNSTGCGISAVQIGVLKKVCLIKINGRIYTLINPTIVKTRGEILFKEGCLSAPDTYKEVKRFQKVWCEYTDENGRKRELADGGLCSVIIQHELDHFEGWCEVFDKVEIPDKSELPIKKVQETILVDKED